MYTSAFGRDKEIERIKSDGVVGILDKKQKKRSSTYMSQTDRVTAGMYSCELVLA